MRKTSVKFMDKYLTATCYFRLLQDTRDIPNIGTTKGLGVDEDTALVITDLFTRPVGTVWFGDLFLKME